ncbi:MAG: hypothetical protein GY946_10210, partial [bacterium]|nr:hypothetical protein [bacterium]
MAKRVTVNPEPAQKKSRVHEGDPELSGAVGATIPASAPVAPAASQGTQDAQMLALPAAEAGGSRQHMKWIVKEVLEKLPDFLAQHVPSAPATELARHPPLEVRQEASDAGDRLASYKEPWQKDNCLPAVRATGFYEAGGSLFWVKTDVAESQIPSEDPSWAWVLEYGAQTLQPQASAGRRARIRFPLAIETYVREESDLTAAEFPVALSPIGAHPVIYSWYAAMCAAMRAEDVLRVTLLYECALCATICVRVEADFKNLLLESLKFSDRIRSEERALTDTFVLFAEKMEQIIYDPDTKKRLEYADIAKLGVRFAGVGPPTPFAPPPSRRSSL